MSLRECLRQPIPEIEACAELLSDAVTAHLNGDRTLAADLFRRADSKVVWEWTDSVWGTKSPYNQPVRLINSPAKLPVSARRPGRDPTKATISQIHARDGYYCRFCKMPVIRAEVRKIFHVEYPESVPWGSKNNQQHAGFQCMWTQYDHIVPHSRGGSSELNNVYLTCAACNYGRNQYLLEEMDLLHPDQHPRRVGSWDGLERVFRST